MRKTNIAVAAMLLLVHGITSGILVSAAQARNAALTDPAQLCLAAARQAAQYHDVPFDVMHKIALVETGRQTATGMAPWPWAVHANGQGHWPATRDGALAIIRNALDGGHSNIDIGCFQINYHWHARHFPSLDIMLDPARNADYAAQLLHGHFQRLGTWADAVGAYHSATPELAQRYVARFNALAAPAGPAPSPAASPAAPYGQSTYALLQPGDGGVMGSLVSLSLLQAAQPIVETGTRQR
ncbi:transglycosylase SLT domain-containing protein [Roseinatronobacter alkalisoli]|uniref:Transglycosylase SLT domain-containing protein n=1 Tax=Roseinatronobacter alkalisoli TaxID=3028235 RepID=A0ABT5T4X2_9RHOB|nr:transglycosylase SLT domain-containing protein [Roseinatronobacter sp. HJB301]MDD7970165.1 transglycosylase SLT domain-containing protein [Roseinatronobacter sp. HJB301]